MKALLATIAIASVAVFAPAEAQAKDHHRHSDRSHRDRCDDGHRHSNSSYRGYRYAVPQYGYSYGSGYYRDRHYSGAAPRYDRYGHRVDSRGHHVDRYGRHID